MFAQNATPPCSVQEKPSHRIAPSGGCALELQMHQGWSRQVIRTVRCDAVAKFKLSAQCILWVGGRRGGTLGLVRHKTVTDEAALLRRYVSVLM